VALARDPDGEAARALAALPHVQVLKGDCNDLASLNAAMAGCAGVVATYGCKPNRFSQFSDLWTDPLSPEGDPKHQATVLYRGMENVLAACKTHGVKKVVRLSGLASGFKPWNPILVLFCLVLSFTPRWARRAEDAIRKSGVDYTVIRAPGLKDGAPASVTCDYLVCASDSWGENEEVPATSGIARADIADLCCLALDEPGLQKATIRVSRARRPTAGSMYMMFDTRAKQTWTELVPSVVPDREQELRVNNWAYNLPVLAIVSGLTYLAGAVFSTLLAVVAYIFTVVWGTVWPAFCRFLLTLIG